MTGDASTSEKKVEIQVRFGGSLAVFEDRESPYFASRNPRHDMSGEIC